jgi:hypothetical protein
MIRFAVLLIACVSLFSCKSKKKENKDAPFPVVSFLKGQVKELSKGGHVFTRIQVSNGKTDTSRITLQELGKYTSEFTGLPDISSKNKKDDYDQSNTYDDYMRKSILTYTALEPDDEVRMESVILGTNEKAEGTVETIIVSRLQEENDATVEKELTWHVGRRFQVVTKTSDEKKPEQISTVIITWE